jgi:hypothetical protein
MLEEAIVEIKLTTFQGKQPTGSISRPIIPNTLRQAATKKIMESNTRLKRNILLQNRVNKEPPRDILKDMEKKIKMMTKRSVS